MDTQDTYDVMYCLGPETLPTIVEGELVEVHAREQLRASLLAEGEEGGVTQIPVGSSSVDIAPFSAHQTTAVLPSSLVCLKVSVADGSQEGAISCHHFLHSLLNLQGRGVGLGAGGVRDHSAALIGRDYTDRQTDRQTDMNRLVFVVYCRATGTHYLLQSG